MTEKYISAGSGRFGGVDTGGCVQNILAEITKNVRWPVIFCGDFEDVKCRFCTSPDGLGPVLMGLDLISLFDFFRVHTKVTRSEYPI